MGNSNVKKMWCWPMRNENVEENSVANADGRKIKNIMELPDEMLWMILSNLSKYDILQNVAHISKKFRELAQDLVFLSGMKFFTDPLLIKSLYLPPKREFGRMTEEEIKQYYSDFMYAFKTSQNLKFLSLDFKGWDFGWEMDTNYGYIANEINFLAELTMANHELLEEFHLNGHVQTGGLMAILQYQCPNLKILQLEFVVTARNIPHIFEHMLKPGIFNGFNFCHFKDLEVLDLKFNRGVYNLTDQQGNTDQQASEKLLNCLKLAKINFLKLQTLRLCASLEFSGPYWVFIPEREKFLDAVSQIALEMGITIEINTFGNWNL